MSNFIGIHGLAGSGKSTSASHLRQEYGFHQTGMSDTLKGMVSHLFRKAQISEDRIQKYVYGTQEEKLEPIPELRNVTGRHIMKTIGSEWRDMIYPELWADISLLWIREMLESGHDVVADDIRFEHEIKTLTEAFGDEYSVTFIKIKRDNKIDAASDGHQSERPLPDHLFTQVINNDAGLNELLSSMDGFMKNIRQDAIMNRAS